MFEYRQKIEQHPNPSIVRCENILETTFETEQFNLVTYDRLYSTRNRKILYKEDKLRYNKYHGVVLSHLA